MFMYIEYLTREIGRFIIKNNSACATRKRQLSYYLYYYNFKRLIYNLHMAYNLKYVNETIMHIDISISI